MDSMLLWDRRKTDARYDLDLTNMTDLELLLQLYRTVPASWHLGTPLHDYLKLTVSMSNGPGVTEKMLRSKRELLRRLEAGFYPMADAARPRRHGTLPRAFPSRPRKHSRAAMAEEPGLLFEDHLEPMLRSNAPTRSSSRPLLSRLAGRGTLTQHGGEGRPHTPSHARTTVGGPPSPKGGNTMLTDPMRLNPQSDLPSPPCGEGNRRAGG